MAVTRSPSHSQPQQHKDDDDDLQHQDPNPIQSKEAEQSPPRQPPNSETLDPPNPHQSPLHDDGVQNPQKSDKDEEALLTHDVDDQQSQQKDDHQTGMSHATIPEPIVLPEETKNPPPSPAPPPLASPVNPQRRLNKRKKAFNRNPHKRKKLQNLTDILQPIPFIPTKKLDFVKHEEVLKRLGLYEFSKIEFDRSIRTDLVVQLIVNYDQKKRCSYVNDVRLNLNRAELSRTLKLPAPRPEKGSSSTVEEVDLDSEVFSDEAIGFIDNFVSSWMLLHEDSWVMPPDLAKMTRCVKDGHPEKMDPARLVWHMVEKELTQGDKLVDCYYASHLQYLIRSQRPEFFMDEDEGVANDIAEDVEEKEEKQEKQEEEEKERIEEENEEKSLIVEEQGIELTLGSNVKEIVQEEVKKDDEVMVDAEEHKEDEVVADEVEEEVVEEVEEEEEEEEEEEQGNWLSSGKNEPGNHFLQRCNSDLNNYEEQKVEELEDEDEDEQIQQVEDEDDEEEEEEEEEEGGERADERFNMEANDDSLDRDGLTGNFLQGVEASHNPFNGMDLFGSREGSFMSHGGPSSFFNGGKRVMETEEHITHVDPNHKRLKTDEIWGQKPTDFNTCMDQMQQWMEKAKMLHESKEQAFENSQYNHELAINQLQERQNYMEMLIKSKDEELSKKHTEVFRLERELYLMRDLVAGYRQALNDTRFKFSEYRKRYSLHEEPIYKDAGPGGLVLSTRELEKQRVKQEEDRVKILKMLKDHEEECVSKLGMHHDKVLKMADKLVSVENEVKNLKGMSVERKSTRDKPELVVESEEKRDEGELLGVAEVHQKSVEEDQEMSVEPEVDQKVEDEVMENDENVESVPLHADESKEKEGGED
ncbi:unnamed protein product [Lactuca saligna]|uniref:Uncharacterized protein n=1 Tax=Lactuca saligna TaxID=75948 RepID=A0AA36EKX1_LACSI|nr:unnamed protein product [Lactuca saligna]